MQRDKSNKKAPHKRCFPLTFSLLTKSPKRERSYLARLITRHPPVQDRLSEQAHRLSRQKCQNRTWTFLLFQTGR